MKFPNPRHGAWVLATMAPERAIGVVSSAGWIKKEQYGDSNNFFLHDVAGATTEPALRQVSRHAEASTRGLKSSTKIEPDYKYGNGLSWI